MGGPSDDSLLSLEAFPPDGRRIFKSVSRIRAGNPDLEGLRLIWELRNKMGDIMNFSTNVLVVACVIHMTGPLSASGVRRPERQFQQAPRSK